MIKVVHANEVINQINLRRIFHSKKSCVLMGWNSSEDVPFVCEKGQSLWDVLCATQLRSLNQSTYLDLINMLYPLLNNVRAVGADVIRYHRRDMC